MTNLTQHLESRHVDLSLHNVWIDEEDYVATFPLWNLSGQMIGYQNYRPNSSKLRKNDEKGRYYTYRGVKLAPDWMEFPNRNVTCAVWGLESWYLSNTLFVVEGVFDAARLTKMGCSAIALLANDPDSSLANWLFELRAQRPVVAVCDPGKAGAKLAKTGHVSHTVNMPGMPDADLGDVDDAYVRNLINTYRNLK